MLKSGFCDCSDAYTLVKEIITTTGAGADAAGQNADNRNKELTFKKLCIIC